MLDVLLLADFDVTIPVEPISITGRVTREGKPARATVALRYGKNIPKSETNEDGEYSLRVWRQGRYQLEVTMAETEPHLDMLLITGDQKLDIELPTNRLSVRVIDASNAKAIASARISVSSDWIDPAKGRRRSMRQVTTDAEGVAHLPPFYPGKVSLQAWADGYLEGKPVAVPIAPETASRVIDIALRREEESTTLSLVLPNGAPAAGAEVIAVREPFSSTAELWRDRADSTGTIRVPRSMNGALLAVRHESAAGTVRPWQSRSDASWSLGPSASEPLLVRARDRHGEQLRNVPVTAWIDGIRVGGLTLWFLAWSEPATDERGVWLGRHLPAASLRILIGNTNRAFDALATTINYPWSGPQTVTAIE
jgi:hypothetical protein